MPHSSETMFNGNGFMPTQDELLKIKPVDDHWMPPNLLQYSGAEYPQTVVRLKTWNVRDEFMKVLTKIEFYKNQGTYQAVPTKCFLAKVVKFIDNNHVSFWQCADWMQQYLIDSRELLETYLGYDWPSEFDLLAEINAIVSENLKYLYGA